MYHRILAILLFAALLLSGCQGSPADSVPDPLPDFPVVIGETDIAQEPQAILSLSPGITEMLFDMGFGDRVVGISDYCDYPAEAVSKPKCGSPLEMDKAAIRKLAPDLLVSSVQLIESDLTWCQQQNIPVLVLEYASDWDSLKQNYIKLATAILGENTGAAAGAEYYAGLQALLDEAKGYGDAYLAGHDTPLKAILLREMSYGMATGDTFEGSLLELIGLQNDAAGYRHWRFDQADVADLLPDVIFADDSIPVETITGSVVYKPVEAVLHGKVTNVPIAAFERQSPRMFQLLLEMSKFAYEVPGGASS